MKKALITITLLAVTASLTACSNEETKINEWSMATTNELPDGRTVICVRTVNGGIDCDWDHAK